MTYIFSLKKENRNLHKRLNDKIYHNRRYEQESLKAELKYLPQPHQSNLPRQYSEVNRSTGILKKSDGFGYTSMVNYSRPNPNDDSFQQYKDLADIINSKQRQKVKFNDQHQ